jgi:hypothetical protein
MRMPAGTFGAGGTSAKSTRISWKTADLVVAGCHEQRPDSGLVGKRARVDHDTRAGRGELEEPVRPPLRLGEDPGAHTAPVPGEPDDPEREDLDVRRAADEQEPGADLPVWRLDDRDVALAVDDRVASAAAADRSTRSACRGGHAPPG